MKLFPFLLSLILLTACSSPVGDVTPVAVHHYGALRKMMHQGDISAQADLQMLQDKEHLYALGALDQLQGELLIWDSRPYLASTAGEEVVIEQTFDRQATLLVYAQVAEWVNVAVPAEITTYAALEEFIAAAAKQQGIDPAAPFPFLLKGSPVSIAWHVINWPEGDTEHTHEKHRRSGPHGILTQSQVEVLGFYSTQHKGVFTHHTTHMHLHFRVTDGSLAGHVDDLQPAPDMQLFLPVQ